MLLFCLYLEISEFNAQRFTGYFESLIRRYGLTSSSNMGDI